MDKTKAVLTHIMRLYALFSVGGITYLIIELLWRQRTHWTMAFVGGACFVLIGIINEWFTFEMYLELQAVIASIIVTVIEFISGCVINLHFKLEVWDYSDLPLNIMGQVCLLFTFLWFILAFAGIYLDDVMRKALFSEPMKPYRSWTVEKIKKLRKK